MKTKDIEIGQTYNARVSGVLRLVKIEREHAFNANGRTRFDALNLETNRRLVVSAARLRPIGHAKIQSCQCGTCGHQLAATCRGKGCVCCPCKPQAPKQSRDEAQDEAERAEAADPDPTDQQEAEDMQPASEDAEPGLDDDALQGALDAIAGTVAEAVAPCNAAPAAPRPAPLTPPGTVQANDEATANLDQIRHETAAAAIRNGFGHRAQVAPKRPRRLTDPQASLFDPPPAQQIIFVGSPLSPADRKRETGPCS